VRPLPRRFFGLVLGGALLALAGGCSEGAALTSDSEPAGACQSAPTDEEWSDLQRYPTAFGLDYFKIRGDQPVTIISVRLVGSTGGLKLVDVAFVPSGGVGGAMRYDSNRLATDPRAWRARVSMPGAVLKPLHASRQTLKATPSADDWQVVVGVLPTTELGMARGVEIVYRSGSRRRTIRGRFVLALSRADAGCRKAADVLSPVT
jgi:hypothetical protein